MNTPAAAPAPAAPSTPSSTPGPSSTPTPSSSGSRPSLSADQFRAKVMSGGGADVSDDSPVEFENSSDDETNLEAASAEQETEPEVPLDEEGEVDDTWLEELREYKEIHGLSSKEVLAALAAGNIPDALLDKIQIELKDGDERWTAPLSEARNGAMRASKFSKKMAELANDRNTFGQEQAAFNTERDQLVHMIKNWQADPKALLNGMRRMGLPVEDAARAFAEELHQLEQMGPGAQELYKAKQQAEMELLELKQRQEWYESQYKTNQATQAEQQAKAQTAQDVSYVQNTARDAFKVAGLKMTQGSWSAFLSHLNPLWASEGKLSPSIIRDAVSAAKEDVENYVTQHKSAAAPVAPKIAGKPLDGGAPKKVSPAGKPKSISSDEFRRRLFNR